MNLELEENHINFPNLKFYFNGAHQGIRLQEQVHCQDQGQGSAGHEDCTKIKEARYISRMYHIPPQSYIC
jgi:hypothetical protein